MIHQYKLGGFNIVLDSLVLHRYEEHAPEALKKFADTIPAGDWDLTLFTCTYGNRHRLAVRCFLTD